jgi:hypothetical protein
MCSGFFTVLHLSFPDYGVFCTRYCVQMLIIFLLRFTLGKYAGGRAQDAGFYDVILS